MFEFAQAGEPSIGVAALPQDLSPWGKFQHADIINKDDRIFLRADRSVPYGDVMINEIRAAVDYANLARLMLLPEQHR